MWLQAIVQSQNVLHFHKSTDKVCLSQSILGVLVEVSSCIEFGPAAATHTGQRVQDGSAIHHKSCRLLVFVEVVRMEGHSQG